MVSTKGSTQQENHLLELIFIHPKHSRILILILLYYGYLMIIHHIIHSQHGLWKYLLTIIRLSDSFGFIFVICDGSNFIEMFITRYH